MTASDLWTRCLETIREDTEHQSYQTWFEPTRALERHAKGEARVIPERRQPRSAVRRRLCGRTHDAALPAEEPPPVSLSGAASPGRRRC